MVSRSVTCVHDGDTFVGRYRTLRYHGVEAVTLQFDGSAVSRRLDGQDPYLTARSLLRELVLQQLIQKDARATKAFPVAAPPMTTPLP